MNVFKKSNAWVYLIILSSALAISGCGPKSDSNQDDSESGGSGNSTVSLSVSDSFEKVQVASGVATIDLQSKTIASDSNAAIQLSQMTQIGEDRSECAVVDIRDTYFQIDTTRSKSCDYHVYMTAKGSEANTPAIGTVRVVVSNLEDTTAAPPQLPALSMTVEKSQCKQVNVVDALQGQVDLTGYELNDDIQALGGGGEATANIAGENVIEFCGFESSVNQIYYSMTSSDGENTSAGVLSASVSTDISIAPQADNFSGPVVKPNMPITIDVCASGQPEAQTSEDCHIATELEDADLQLIGVYSYDSTVSVLDKDDVTNTSFIFEAENLGSYDVSYMISDHRGGYDVGVTRVVVTDDPQLPGWDDITLSDGTVYKAPLTTLSAEVDGKLVEESYIETTPSGIFDVAIYGYDNAKQLCESYGMSLPTLSQMQDLYSEVGNVSSSEGWPVGRNYWLDASEGSSDYFSMDLSDQSVQTEASDTSTRNVTCVLPAVSLSLTASKNNGLASVDKNEVTATLTTKDGTPIEGEVVSFEAADSSWVYSLDSTATTDADGNATVSFGAFSSGTYTMRATYLGVTAETETTFIADYVDSVDIKGASTVKVNSSIQLSLDVDYASGTSETVTSEASWSSSKTSVATVSNSGRVTGRSGGSATITATYQGKSSTHKVTVEENEGIILTFEDGSKGSKTFYVPADDNLYIFTPVEGTGSCKPYGLSKVDKYSSNTDVAARVGYNSNQSFSWKGSESGHANIGVLGNGSSGCSVGTDSNILTVVAEYL